MIKNWENDEAILNHYATTIRKKIKKELFPADLEDWTIDIYRFDTWDSDLEKAKKLFRGISFFDVLDILI